MGRNFREMFERVRITKLMNLAKSRRSESLSQIGKLSRFQGGSN